MSADKPVSYRWEINGKRVLNPSPLILYDDHKGPGMPMLSINCPRGAHPGKAYLLMRKDDAETVLAIQNHQVISITEFQQTIDGNWDSIQVTEFGGYYALSSSCVVGKIQDQVVVELADERYKLSESHVRRKFNVTTREAVGMAGAQYDPDSLNSSSLWTYGEILDEILSAVQNPPSLSLPVAPATPHNLIFDCSAADAIDQLLASIGCALLFDPTANSGNEFSVEELSIDQDLAILDTATQDGRLIEKYSPANSENVKPKNTTIFPNEFATIQGKAKLIPLLPSSLGAPSTDFPSVDIFDHEFEPDVARINDAVDAWYKPLKNPRSDVYQGILLAKTGSDVTSVTWAFTPNGHRTIVKNLLPSAIPWPQQPALLNTKDLVRFVLTANLAASGSAAATITSTGPDNGFGITVTDWAGNTGESGNKGVAWKDESTYWVIEIKAGSSVELFRFTLTADLAIGGTATATTTPATTTITVTDWAGNPGKSGQKGVAWKDGSTYWVIEIKNDDRTQFITGSMSSGGSTFNGATAETFTLGTIVGVDRAWTGASTVAVTNPQLIKVWMNGSSAGDCLIKCQWNQATGGYEVLTATQKFVVQGVRLTDACTFQLLNSTGTQNWNSNADFATYTATTGSWVTQVYINEAGTQLVYDKRCSTNILIDTLNDCTPDPPPE